MIIIQLKKKKKNQLCHWEKSQHQLQNLGGDSSLLLLGRIPCFVSGVSRAVISGFLGLPLLVWNSILTQPFEHTGVRVIGTPVFSACPALGRTSAQWVATRWKKGDFDVLATFASNLASTTWNLERWELLMACFPERYYSSWLGSGGRWCFVLPEKPAWNGLSIILSWGFRERKFMALCVFCCCWAVCVFYVLNINPLSDIWVANVFSPSVRLPLFCWWFPLLCRSSLVWCSPICLFLSLFTLPEKTYPKKYY